MFSPRISRFISSIFHIIRKRLLRIFPCVFWYQLRFISVGEDLHFYKWGKKVRLALIFCNSKHCPMIQRPGTFSEIQHRL